MEPLTDITVVDLGELPRERLERMAAAGDDILECYRVLAKGGANVVSEVLREQGKFYEWDHFPKGDVYDGETHSQYYYHAHRVDGPDKEHGHFHTFLRHPGMPPGVEPVPYDGDEEWPKGKDALSHLVAISMDSKGFPISLFTTNRWVTGETWYKAADVRAMVDRFLMDHSYPSWPANRWISAMLRLFYPQVSGLLDARDEAVERYGKANPETDVFEDRELDVTSILDVSVDEQIEHVRRALA